MFTPVGHGKRALSSFHSCWNPVVFFLSYDTSAWSDVTNWTDVLFLIVRTSGLLISIDDVLFQTKLSLDIDFCNLPYIIDGETSFAKSVACLTYPIRENNITLKLRYACQKAGIHKDFSMAEEAKALSYALSVQDLRDEAVGHFYGTYDGVKQEVNFLRFHVLFLEEAFVRCAQVMIFTCNYVRNLKLYFAS